MLKGQKLINSNKDEFDAEEVVKDSKVLLLYFSAHWCPPCRGFTPVLKEFYEEISKDSSDLCIIFVSSDRDENSMISYFKEHGGYYAVPFSNSDLSKQLKEKCSVRGIPMLCHVNKDISVIYADNVRDTLSTNSPTKSMEILLKQL